MEIKFEESRSLLNIKTGEIVVVTSEELRSAEDDEPYDHLPDWQQEDRKIAIDVVENYDDNKELSTKYEINEYD